MKFAPLMLIALGQSKVRVTYEPSKIFPFVVEVKRPGTQWVYHDGFVRRSDAFRAAADFAEFLSE
jgi:hypothetical protein